MIISSEQTLKHLQQHIKTMIIWTRLTLIH
nr:MAG TPA: hypothetical protein [Caudoviricetes sp.]